MEVYFEVDKILNVLYIILFLFLFFPSGGGVDDVLARLSLIKLIIKHANLTCLSFSVKHPQIFWES